jgi:cytoskeletal protein RodZ
MKITGKRIFTAVTLVLAVITLYQVLSRPQPIAEPQTPESATANAQSFDQKLAQLQAPRTEGSEPAEVHFSSQEVSAEMAQSMNPAPTPASATARPASSTSTSPDSTLGPGEVTVKDYQVELQGDVARGQFVTQVAGKDLYVTLAGHLGSQDGYVTFDPTEVKVGEMSIPVSLVNASLQKKLAEQREQLKLPDGIASLRVENGELVITQK